MMRYCEKTDCPRNKTIVTTKIDTQTRMPTIVHVCTCDGQTKCGICWRCAGL